MTRLIAYGGVALCIIGMMLVIAGVIATGLFLPGVFVLVVGMLAFAAAGLLPLFKRTSD
jgi:hypothetical protein